MGESRCTGTRPHLTIAAAAVAAAPKATLIVGGEADAKGAILPPVRLTDRLSGAPARRHRARVSRARGPSSWLGAPVVAPQMRASLRRRLSPIQRKSQPKSQTSGTCNMGGQQGTVQVPKATQPNGTYRLYSGIWQSQRSSGTRPRTAQDACPKHANRTVLELLKLHGRARLASPGCNGSRRLNLPSRCASATSTAARPAADDRKVGPGAAKRRSTISPAAT